MRCVVLDGHTLNPGDLSWAPLEALLPSAIYPRTPPDEVVPRAEDAAVALTNKVVLSAAVLSRLPQLKYIGVTATGYNCVDAAEARRRGVVVANVPTYSTRSVAQLVFAHLLDHAHGVAAHSQGVHEGRWSRSPDFCYWQQPLVELAGLTMGIVGFGRIGRTTAAIARALGMNVIACGSKPIDGGELAAAVDLDTLFRTSDVISLHCPLTEQTRGLVDHRRLAMMKPTAYLINAARGPLIDEAALAEALAVGRIAGAGLDVLSEEPPPADHPLLRLANCTITPHIAWATRAARQRLLDTAVENVRAFLAGRPQNVVG